MNHFATPLSAIAEGDRVRVRELRTVGAMRRRLLDLGLVAGTPVCCLQKSPAGDPTAYRVRGAVVALRAEDAADILVE